MVTAQRALSRKRTDLPIVFLRLQYGRKLTGKTIPKPERKKRKVKPVQPLENRCRIIHVTIKMWFLLLSPWVKVPLFKSPVLYLSNRCPVYHAGGDVLIQLDILERG